MNHTARTATVVVPSYNRPALLVETTQHLLAQLGAGDRLVVVDQSSEPNPAMDDLARAHPPLRYLRITEKGLPNARNVGASHATGEVVVFCDDDVVPRPGFLAAHKAAYDDATVGAVAGRVLFPAATPPPPRHFGTIRRADFRVTSGFHGDTPAWVDHFQGCNFSIRRDLYARSVASDPRFAGTAHLEETDLALQVTAAGYRIRFEPAATLVHLVDPDGGCRAPDLERWLYWYGHNYMLLFRKHGRSHHLPTFLAARLTKLVLTGLTHGQPRFLLAGIQGMVTAAGWRPR